MADASTRMFHAVVLAGVALGACTPVASPTPATPAEPTPTPTPPTPAPDPVAPSPAPDPVAPEPVSPDPVAPADVTPPPDPPADPPAKKTPKKTSKKRPLNDPNFPLDPVTRARPLPHDDPAVARLDPAARAAMARHWQRRAWSEGQVADAFTDLHAGLQATAASPVVLALIARAITDEQRHSGVCSELAATYAGAPIAATTPPPLPLPRFADVPPAVEVALQVVGLCCINETLATVWLEACLAAARTPLARAANRVHLAEEVDHARAGWAHLATLTPADRAAVDPWLLAFVRSSVHAWLRAGDDLPLGTGLESHGILDPAAHRATILRGARDVVLPGLAHLGLDTDASRHWLAALA